MSTLIESSAATYTENTIEANYAYETCNVETTENGTLKVSNSCTNYSFKTERTLPRTGMMLVGLGGNNGSTVAASLLAHREKLTWNTKEQQGLKPNFYGSVLQASTVKLGDAADGSEVYVPLTSLVPTVAPEDLIVGGWDINNMNLADAVTRAKVLDYDLQRQVAPILKDIVPLPSIYYPDFIASNQEARANNLIAGDDKFAHLEQIRKDIREFKSKNSLDKVIVCWTANTERFAELIDGVNDTAENLMASIKSSHEEISASSIFAVAAILEGVPFINGSPQNTYVPGVVELAEQHKALIAGDDFKSGQTKLKSVLVDFLVNAGIKPLAIASYNHLGNNDGKNLSEARQFRSKEITKTNVVDDMVESNRILFEEGEKPDHLVVIKYLPTVGDSKRAMDEYTSEIFMHGRNTITLSNVCEDSLLAAPLILDLVILTELMTRVEYKADGVEEFQPFHSVLSVLSYLLKAPMVKKDTPVINGLARQRAALVNLLKAFVGLKPCNDMLLQHKVWDAPKVPQTEM